MYDVGSGLYSNDTMDRMSKYQLQQPCRKYQLKSDITITFDLESMKFIKRSKDGTESRNTIDTDSKRTKV